MIAGALPLHILVQKHNFPTDKNAMADVSLRVQFKWQSGNVTFELIQDGVQKDWNCTAFRCVLESVYVCVFVCDGITSNRSLQNDSTKKTQTKK